MGLFTKTPAEQHGADLLDRLPLGISIYRLEAPDDPRSFRLVYGNPASGRITGLDPAAEVDRPAVEIAPGLEASGLLDAFAEILRDGAPRDLGPVEYGDERIEAGTYGLRVIPLADDAVAVVFEDLAERSEVQALRAARDAVEQARAASAREAERSRTLLDAVGDVVLVYPITADGPGPFVAFNEAAVARYGYSPDELRGMTVLDLIDPDRTDGEKALEELRKTRASTFESVHRTRAGDRLYMSTHARLVEVDGQLCVVSLCRDDADRRQFRREIARTNRELEAAVAERTAQLEAFSEDLKILHAITTAEHPTRQARFDAYLAAGCEMFDLPIGILSSTPTDEDTGERMYRLEAVVSPDPEMRPGLTVPLAEAFCDAVVEHGQTVTYADATEEAPDHPACLGRGLRAFIGTPVTVEGELVGTLNFVSPEPRPGGFSAVERDLIEVMAQAVGRRLEADAAEDAEQTAQAEYRTIVETVDAGVIVVDRDLEIVMSNPSAREFLGLDVAHGPRETGDLRDRWPVVDADGVPVPAVALPERRVLQSGRPVRGEIQGIVPPGEPVRWYRVNATPLDEDADGTPEAVVVSFHDVTDFRSTALSSERSQDLLEAVLAASTDGVAAFRAVRGEGGQIEDFEWLLATPAAAEAVGRTPGELVGQRLLVAFPHLVGSDVAAAYVRVVVAGEVYEDTVPSGLEAGASYRVRAVPLGVEDGLAVSYSKFLAAESVGVEVLEAGDAEAPGAEGRPLGGAA